VSVVVAAERDRDDESRGYFVKRMDPWSSTCIYYFYEQEECMYISCYCCCDVSIKIY
jgi:hypothetical protein